MEIKILVFGSLTDVIGSTILTIEHVDDTNSLVNELIAKFNSLKDKAFVISINKKISTENTRIDASSEIALLPPFSGG